MAYSYSSNSQNGISLDSFFTKEISDNNGITVCDINEGLVNLFKNFNDYSENISQIQRYLVSEEEEGFPDLIAKRSILSDQQYWWWILLLNRLENPFTEIKANWVYSINSTGQINNFINNTNSINSSTNNDRIGKVIELN